MTIYSGFFHEKWWFSIAMLNYQRVYYIYIHYILYYMWYIYNIYIYISSTDEAPGGVRFRVRKKVLRAWNTHFTYKDMTYEIWDMICDMWCMMYDVWCMMYDMICIVYIYITYMYIIYIYIYIYVYHICIYTPYIILKIKNSCFEALKPVVTR